MINQYDKSIINMSFIGSVVVEVFTPYAVICRHITSGEPIFINLLLTPHVVSHKLSLNLKINKYAYLFSTHSSVLNDRIHFIHTSLNVSYKAGGTQTQMRGCLLCTPANTNTHAHTKAVVGGRGNPLSAFLSSSYECLSDIQRTHLTVTGPSSEFS